MVLVPKTIPPALHTDGIARGDGFGEPHAHQRHAGHRDVLLDREGDSVKGTEGIPSQHRHLRLLRLLARTRGVQCPKGPQKAVEFLDPGEEVVRYLDGRDFAFADPIADFPGRHPRQVV